MDLTNDDVLKILSIIDESDYQDIRLEIGDFKLHVQKQVAQDHGVAYAAIEPEKTAPVIASQEGRLPASAVRAAPPAPIAAAPAELAPDGAIAVTAPILGTFYRASAPGEKPFVDVGSKVGANDTLCLIEVMKLFNSVKAGVAGTVVKILAENGSMVEHGQVLVYIQPDV